MAGINDVANCSVEEFGKQYETLVLKLKELLPDASIVIQSMLPVNNRDFSISCNNELIEICNKAIEKIAEFFDLKYIDLYELYFQEGVLSNLDTMDGLHIKRESYYKWFQGLRRYY